MRNLKNIFYLLAFLVISIPVFSQDYYVYVSSYSKDNNTGIYMYKFNEENGSFEYSGQTSEVHTSSYLCLRTSGKYLYSVAFGEIAAFAIDNDSGNLTLINKQETGKGPCYVSIDHTGKWVFVSNYPDGFIEVFPVKGNGALGVEQQRIIHKGSSVNKSRQEAPHPHMIMSSPMNRFVIVPDLGADKIMVYRLNAKTGMLKPNQPYGVKASPGAGPRHFAFHPNGKYGYVLNELNSTVTAYKWDEHTGTLTPMETLQLLPGDFSDYNKSADIHLTPDGNFLYASNRGHNSITAFRVERNGQLTLIDYYPSGGDFPRNFYITPHGKYLIVENKHSGNIVRYKLDNKTGQLNFEEKTEGLIAPQCIKMLQVK